MPEVHAVWIRPDLTNAISPTKVKEYEPGRKLRRIPKESNPCIEGRYRGSGSVEKEAVSVTRKSRGPAPRIRSVPWHGSWETRARARREQAAGHLSDLLPPPTGDSPTNFKQNERRTLRRIPEESNPGLPGRYQDSGGIKEKTVSGTRKSRGTTSRLRSLARESLRETQEWTQREQATGHLNDLAPPQSGDSSTKTNEYEAGRYIRRVIENSNSRNEGRMRGNGTPQKDAATPAGTDRETAPGIRSVPSHSPSKRGARGKERAEQTAGRLIVSPGFRVRRPGAGGRRRFGLHNVSGGASRVVKRSPQESGASPIPRQPPHSRTPTRASKRLTGLKSALPSLHIQQKQTRGGLGCHSI